MNSIIPIRVLIVDDHDVVRLGLSTFLKSFHEVEVVGQASNGIGALQASEELQPDIVLMDVMMPGMNGIEATLLIHEQFPHIKIIALTSLKEEKPIRAMLEAGATGYLLKDAPVQEFFEAIKAVYSGSTVLSPEVMPVLLQTQETKQLYDLTSRELEVLSLMVKGLGNREIGVTLNISLSTVKFHVTGIIEKLNVHNRVDAVALAVTKQLVS